MKARPIIFIFLCLSLASCYYKKAEFEKSSGQVNKIKKGEKFRISLPEDHASKYLWALAKDIPTKRVQYNGSVFHGTYVDFNFEAVGKGREELSLFLYSAKDTLEKKAFVVEVE